MKKTQHLFRINVGFLINQPIGFTREFPFNLEQFKFDEDNQVENLSGKIVLSRTQSGVQAMIDCTAQMDVQCVRCLDEFKQQLQTSFQELFTFSRTPRSEDEQSIRADGYIDFKESIKDYLEIQIPIKPLCREECRGLCSICGANLNECECEHVKQT